MSGVMRVLSVLTSRSQGGAEYAAVDLLAALERRGVRARLLTDQPGLVAGTAVEAGPIALGPKLNRSSAPRTVALAPLLRRSLRRALEDQARRDDFDVLLLHFKKEQLLAATLPARITRSIVWAEWGPLPREFRSGPARHAYVRAAEGATAILAESEATRQSLVSAGVPGRKISLIGNVFDVDEVEFTAAGRARHREHLRVPDSVFLLGCISRLHPSKHLDVVIDAMQLLPDDIRLFIAGSGEHEASLRARAAPLTQRVTFQPVPRGHVGELLSACDLQVYAPSESEGAARAVTLGQLAGRPIVATAPEGATGLIVPGAGTIISPSRDPSALARTILKYRSDAARRAAEGEAGRSAAVARLAALDPVGTALAALRTAAASRR